ncbi:MAG: hypothetical protein ACI37T_07150 [Candidatus Gastranaerophilaceae bacterium]
MQNQEEMIKEMQEIAKQMVIDDIEENPDSETEGFDCDCCGQYKMLAGSVRYGDYRLCNDCVLIAEISFRLNKIKDVKELIDANEDNRLKGMCEFLKQEETRENN